MTHIISHYLAACLFEVILRQEFVFSYIFPIAGLSLFSNIT